MTVEELIVQTLSDGETPVVQGEYFGTQPRYITFDLASYGTGYGDDRPQALMHMAEIRYTCPATESAAAERRRIAEALEDAGFLFPSISAESANGKQTLVFETQILSGTDWEA